MIDQKLLDSYHTDDEQHWEHVVISSVHSDPETISQEVCATLEKKGIWHTCEDGIQRKWLVSPEPFGISTTLFETLETLGSCILAFYEACDKLYQSGLFPWVNEYLDTGKPDDVRKHNKMNYHKRRLPGVLRPDIILTDDGPIITELDSVPGGIGLTDCLSSIYEQAGYQLIGSPRGLLNGFLRMLCDAAGKNSPNIAIIVSDESADYRPEMNYLAKALREAGYRASILKPSEIIFRENGLFFDTGEQVDVVYRFFELFDLQNIPKSELVKYADKKKLVVVTPPYKTHLEEKMLLALLKHPILTSYWENTMGRDRYILLNSAVPDTFILDPRPVPPHAVIVGILHKGKPIRDWMELAESSQKERRFALKISGYSELAWGGRGVYIGHDLPQEEWKKALERALVEFHTQPYVLQRFQEGKRISVKYFNFDNSEIVNMEARVRLSPYYFHYEGKAHFCGALATACPSNKKIIHGMKEAVLMPCFKLSENDSKEFGVSSVAN